MQQARKSRARGVGDHGARTGSGQGGQHPASGDPDTSAARTFARGHRILADLRELGYLHVVDRRWVAGPRLISLAHRGLSQRAGVLAGIRPTLQEIAAATDETAVYAIRAGDSIISLEQAPSADPIRYVASLWEPYPLETTSPGMVFQAFDEDPPPHLAVVRDYNVGPDHQAAIAAPVRDPRGDIVGAMIVIGRPDRFAEPERVIWAALRDGIRRLEAGGSDDEVQPPVH